MRLRQVCTDLAARAEQRRVGGPRCRAGDEATRPSTSPSEKGTLSTTHRTTTLQRC